MLLCEVEHDVAALDGVVGIDEGIVVGGGLEHAYEDGGVLRLQVFGRTAEVGLAGGLDAKGVGAEVYGVGILRQDLFLGEEVFEFVGGDPFLALHDEHLQSGNVSQEACGVFRACAEEVLGQLLGDGRGTTGVAMEDIVLGDGYEGGIVDAVVMIEMFVFSRDECLPEYGIHLLVGYGRTVLAEELADLLAVGTVDD